MIGRGWDLIRKLFPTKSQRDSGKHDDCAWPDNDAVIPQPPLDSSPLPDEPVHTEEIPLSWFFPEESPDDYKQYTPEFQEKLVLFVLEDYNKLHDTMFELREFDAIQIGTTDDGLGRLVCGYHLYIECADQDRQSNYIFAEVFWCKNTGEAKITVCEIVDPNDQSAPAIKLNPSDLPNLKQLAKFYPTYSPDRQCDFCPRKVVHPKGVKTIMFAKTFCDPEFGGVVVS